MKIGNFETKHPIIQGGMGVGISWSQLAGNVSKEGGLGVISSVGTGYYDNGEHVERMINDKPFSEKNFYSKKALVKLFKDAREICGDAPIACNVLYAINDYGRVVTDACEAGANAIITGAGLPTNMPEFTEGYPEVALIPIVSSVRALKIIIKRWKRYDRMPDAVIVEGPLSGGHQGFSYEDCKKEENKLENLIPPIVEYANSLNIPVIAAGGVWDKNDIDMFRDLGCEGVQMGTRFIGTHECDAHANFKKTIIASTEDTIELFKSPVGYPARGVKTKLFKLMDEGIAPKIKCISNCVSPCNRGEEARKVGYCIADRLSGAFNGEEDGLFFTGANGYRVKELISVKELIIKLTNGE